MTKENTQIQKPDSNPIAMIRNYLNNVNIKARLEEILGKRAGAFANSIINVVRSNASLQKCTPESIMSASLIAATMNLPIDPALGQAAIVPYKSTAQFQIMYKGVTQLCIRSGQYATIHCTEIYADEIKSYNPITGIVTFNEPATYKMRYERKGENVVGHYAYLKLISGFEKSEYMSCEQVMAHAHKYSKAYQYDLRDHKKTSVWSTDPIPMGNKTVLLRLLTKYGVMSIEMQDALVADHNGFEASQAEAAERIAAETGSEPVDAQFEEPESEKKTRKKAAKKKAKKKVEAKEVPQFKWTCKNCGLGFDEARITDPPANAQVCPKCASMNIEVTQQKPEFMED